MNQGVNSLPTLPTLFYLMLFAPGLVSASDSETSTTTVYKYLDENGVLHLTNRPPPDKTASLSARGYPRRLHLGNRPPRTANHSFYWNGYLTILLPAPEHDPVKRLDNPYPELIEQTARRHGLDPALLQAVIQVESAYNPDAVSPKGAVGLMQLMPATAARYQVEDRTDPEENLRGGATYLKYLLELFNQDHRLALAAYHAGEGAVLRHDRQIPPYPETIDYVDKVLKVYQEIGAWAS